MWEFYEYFHTSGFYAIREVADSIGLIYYEYEPGITYILDGGIINGAHLGTTTGVRIVNNDYPCEYKLIQNYPNPFNPTTKISYEVPKRTFVRLQIFNILGQLIQTLVDEEKQPGTFNVSWNAGNVPNGVYFYRINAGNFVDTKKMVVIR